MTRFLFSLTLLIPFAASAQTDRDNTVRRRDPAPAKFWMQRYPLRRYAAEAYIDIAVSDFDRSHEQVQKFIEKLDGESASPIARDPKDTVKYQQFSVVFERKNAERFLARLRVLGKVRRDTRREILHPEIEREAGTKLAQLEMERSAGKENLRALASVRAVLDELMTHLRQAVEAYEASKDRVLIDIVVEQERA